MEPDIRNVFAEVAGHPETTLSRREIIKFILTEATQRSRDVQTLLKLDDIDQTRATLKITENKLLAEQATAKTQADTAEDSLKRHLDLAVLKPNDLLAAVNKCRKVLGLQEISKLEGNIVRSYAPMQALRKLRTGEANTTFLYVADYLTRRSAAPAA